MTIIYCAKDKESQAVASLDLPDPYDFRSPTSTGVVHHASRVVIVGNHPSIEKRYKGIAKVETLTLDDE